MQSDKDEANAPINKGGRPKGRKNRPKWLLKELKAQPKRPRGRPKGSLGKPKSLEVWLEQQLSQNLRETPPPPPPPKKPQHPNCKGTLGSKTKEQRIAIAKKGRATQLKRGIPAGKHIGQPTGWTRRDYVRLLDAAEQEARRIFKIMDKQGSTPENEMAKAALQSAFEMIAQPLQPKDRLAAVRTVLEYTKQKPATQSNVTVKTAEDFLDELEQYDSNQSGAEEAPNS